MDGLRALPRGSSPVTTARQGTNQLASLVGACVGSCGGSQNRGHPAPASQARQSIRRAHIEIPGGLGYASTEVAGLRTQNAVQGTALDLGDVAIPQAVRDSRAYAESGLALS